MFSSSSNAPVLARTRYCFALLGLAILALVMGLEPLGSAAHAQAAEQPSAKVTYDYDDLGRLIKVTYVGGSADGTDVVYDYAYDDAGNRVRAGVDGVVANTVSITDGWGFEGDTLRFPILFAAPPIEPVTLDWSVTAGGEGQVSQTEGQKVFTSDPLAWYIDIPSIDNTTKEGVRTFTVTIAIVDGDVELAGATATGYIQDDDITYFTVNDAASHLEGTYEALTINIARSGTEQQVPINVTLSAIDQTAIAADDFDTTFYSYDGATYTPLAGDQVTFQTSDTSKTVYVKSTDDLNYERDEYFFVDLDWVAPETEGNFPGWERSRIDIPNTDTPPEVYIRGGNAPEGSPITFTLGMTGTSYLPVRVSLTAMDQLPEGADGVAAVAGTDYDATTIPESYTFLPPIAAAPGATVIETTFDVVTLIDGVSEIEDQYFTIDAAIDETVSGGVGAVSSAIETQGIGYVEADIDTVLIGTGDTTLDNGTSTETIFRLPAGQYYTFTLSGARGGHQTAYSRDGGGGGMGTFTIQTQKKFYMRARVGTAGADLALAATSLADITGGGASGASGSNTGGGQGGGATSLVFSENGIDWSAVAIVGGGGGAGQYHDAGIGGGLGLNGETLSSNSRAGKSATTSSSGAGGLYSSRPGGQGGAPGENGEAAVGEGNFAGSGIDLFKIGGGGSANYSKAGGAGSGFYGGGGGTYQYPGGGGSGYFSASTIQSITGGSPTIISNASGGAHGHGAVDINSRSPLSVGIDAGASVMLQEKDAPILTFSVTLSETPSETIELPWSIATVADTTTGIAASDFTTSATSPLIFSAGGPQTQTIDITIVDDSDIEETETLTVTLGDATQGTVVLEVSSASVTIEDDDANNAAHFDAADGYINVDLGTDLEPESSYYHFNVPMFSLVSDALGHDWSIDSVTENYSEASIIVGVDSSGKKVSLQTAFCGPHTVYYTASDAPGDGTSSVSDSGQVTINIPDTNCTDTSETTAPDTPTIEISNAVGSNGFSVTEGDGVDLVYTVDLTGPVDEAVSVDWNVYFSPYVTDNASGFTAADMSGAQSGTINFAANDTSPKEIRIAIVDDSLIEGQELVSVQLSNLSNTVKATLGDSLGSGYIENDDGYGVSIDIANTNAVVEGDGRTLDVTFSLNRPATEALSLPWTVSGGNTVFMGVEPGDYNIPASGQSPLGFAIGDQTKTVKITVVDDTAAESTEALVASLGVASGDPVFYVVGQSSVLFTIADDDTANTAPNAPTIAINNVAWPTNGELGLLEAVFDLSSDLAAVDPDGHTVTITEITTYPGYNTPQALSASGTSVNLATNKCGIHRFIYTIYDKPDGTNLGLGDSAELSINVGESNPTDCVKWITYSSPDLPSISVDDATAVTEGGTLAFTVHLSQPATVPVTVNWNASGADIDAADFKVGQTLSGSVFFDKGSDQETIYLQTADEFAAESDETVTITLDTASSDLLVWQDTTASGVIADSGQAVGSYFTVATVSGYGSATEGAGAGALRVEVSLSPVASDASSVDWVVTGPGASLITSATTGTLNFAAGGLPQTVELSVGDNSVYDGDQAVTVTLSNALPTSDVAVGSAASANLTILEDEVVAPDLPSVSIGGAGSVTEGGLLDFPVSLSKVPSQAVTVNYSVSGVSASDLDSGMSGSISISGTSSGTITVNTADDVKVEGNETVTVTIGSVTNGTKGTPASATGTIIDDDNPAVFSVSTVSGATEGSAVTFKISLTGQVGQSGTVNYTTANGTAGSSDYTAKSGAVSLSAGSSTNISVPTTAGDGWENRSETVKLDISGATGDTTVGSSSSASATISDGDSRPSLNYWFAAATKSESASGFTVYVAKNGKSQVSHSVTLKAENVSAVAGSDYVGFNKTFTFAAGADYQEKTDLVQIKNDSVCGEPDTESFLLNASNATGGATLSNTSKTLKIIDDDNCVPNALNYSVAIGSLGTSKSVTVRKADSDADDSKSSLTIGKPSNISGTLYFTVSGDAILVEAHQCGTWNKSYTLTDPSGASDSGTLSIDVPQSLCDGSGGQPL